jgi:hypothetical protein
VNRRSVFRLSTPQSSEYQEKAKEGQSSVFLLIFVETHDEYDTSTLIFFLNLEEFTIEMRISFVFKRIVAWRTIVLKGD